MCELWIVRHGQTEDNIKQIIAGHQGGKLTNLGILQAEATGKRLNNEIFSLVYCSDLDRTKHTCSIILGKNNHAKNISVEYDSVLREKSGGVLEGKPLKTFRDNSQQQKIPIRLYKPQNGESWKEVYGRAERFLQKIIDKHLKSKLSPQSTSSSQNKIDIANVHAEDSLIQANQQQKQQEEESKFAINNQNTNNNDILSLNSNLEGLNIDDKSHLQKKSLKPGQHDTKKNQPNVNKIKNNTNKVQDKQNKAINCELNNFLQIQQINCQKDVKQANVSGKKSLISPSSASKNSQQQKITSNQQLNSQAKQPILSKELPKILVITHGGFIMEFHNLINYKVKNIQPTCSNVAKNCSLHIFKIFCSRTGFTCTSECSDSHDCIVIKPITINDDLHCANIK